MLLFRLLLLAATASLAASAGVVGSNSRLSRSLPEFADRPAAQYLAEAWSHYQAYRYQEAEQAVRHVLTRDPGNARARYILGVSLSMQRKNLDEAVENLTQAAAVNPEAHLELSRIFIEKGDFARAFQELDAFTRNTKLTAKGQLLAK